jgi:N-methylhydantoinase B
MTLGDLESSMAACRSGEKGMLHLADKYGVKTLNRCFSQLLDYTEKLMRAEISRWPAGEYCFTDHLDDDGVDPEPIPIKVKIIIRGDSVLIDFTGTSPQVRGGINCPLPFTISCCGYALRSVMRAEIPNTSGLFRPITVIAPEGSILNPVMPAASSMRGVVGFRLSDALFGALAQISPSSVPAAGEGGNSLVIIGGYRRDRQPFIMFDLIAGTWGGRPDKDGNDGLTNPGSIVSNIPAEQMELEYPVRLEQYGLVTDSGGAGKYRGGLAIIRDFRYIGDQPANLTIRSDRRAFPPYGLNGGRHGAPSWNIVNPGTGSERILRTKVTDSLQPGDLIRHIQPGGGGWGDPLDRDPVAVLRDVLNDKVSRRQADELYGVVLNATNSAVDEEATSRKRAAIRASAVDSGKR